MPLQAAAMERALLVVRSPPPRHDATGGSRERAAPVHSTPRTRFLVKAGPALKAAPVDEVADPRQEGVVFLVTHPGKRFIVANTLDQMEGQLDAQPVPHQPPVYPASAARKFYYFKGRLVLQVAPAGSTWTQVAVGGGAHPGHHFHLVPGPWAATGMGNWARAPDWPAKRARPRSKAPAGVRWRQCAASILFSLGIQTTTTPRQEGQNPVSPSGGRYGTPQQVVAPGAAAGTTWARESGGPYHVLALRSYGAVWAWGINQYGEVGNGSQLRRWCPGVVRAVA